MPRSRKWIDVKVQLLHQVSDDERRQMGSDNLSSTRKTRAANTRLPREKPNRCKGVEKRRQII
jgi:hypothetical protein